MNKDNVKTVFDYSVLGVCWFGISIMVGIFITLFTRYNFMDILFVEGMLLIMVGVSFEVGSERTWLSLQPLGSPDAQYISNMNLEIAKIAAEEKNDIRRILLSRGLSSISLIIGGIFALAINFII